MDNIVQTPKKITIEQIGEDVKLKIGTKCWLLPEIEFTKFVTNGQANIKPAVKRAVTLEFEEIEFETITSETKTLSEPAWVLGKTCGWEVATGCYAQKIFLLPAVVLWNDGEDFVEPKAVG